MEHVQSTRVASTRRSRWTCGREMRGSRWAWRQRRREGGGGETEDVLGGLAALPRSRQLDEDALLGDAALLVEADDALRALHLGACVERQARRHLAAHLHGTSTHVMITR